MLRKSVREWGLSIFVLDCALGYLALVFRPAGHHYAIFSGGARYLWAGMSPYGADLGVPGIYLYSPSCAMFFFGLFSWLPQRLGQGLYMLASLAVLFAGGHALLGVMREKLGFELQGTPLRHLFWLMAGSEVLGAILGAKIEIFMLGVQLYALALLLGGRREWLAGLLFGAMTNWKFQPLPVIGLVSLILLVHRRVVPVFAFAAGLAIFYLAPAAFLPWPFFLEIHREWNASLAGFLPGGWLGQIYQHVYAFLVRGLGVEIGLRHAQLASVIAGATLAAVLLAWHARLRMLAGDALALRVGLLVAAGVGSAFVVLFNPMSQSNGYLLYLPLLLPVIWMARETGKELQAGVVMVVAFVTISLLYSDIPPRPLYRLAYAQAWKPLGVVLLLSWLGRAAYLSTARQRQALIIE